MNTFVLLTSAVLLGGASQSPDPAQLDSLVLLALEQNPGILAARERVRAARARVAPAGARPDPLLTFSIRNLPVSDPGFEDFMTMKSIGLSQRLPYPGKLPLAREAAWAQVTASEAALADLRLDVASRARQAYYELAFIDRSLKVVNRHRGVLNALISTADVRYAVAAAGQEDVLQAQVEVAALAEEEARLTERRRGVLATLNGVLSRPPLTEVGPAVLPEHLASVAMSPRGGAGFALFGLDGRATDSPLRPLDELLSVAISTSPTIHEHVARIEAQRARLDLARRAHLPDFDVALSYGQRDGRPDMVSLSIALPLPVYRRTRQDAWADEAGAELAALEAEHRAHVDGLRSTVTRLYSDLERDRTSLTLLATAMVPQGSAALQAATAGFGVGRTDFQTVLATQTALFRYEIAFDRALTDFAKNVAELERQVGGEVVR